MHLDFELGEAVVAALEEVKVSQSDLANLNFPGFYDPCGTITQDAEVQYRKAMVALVRSIRAIADVS